MQTPEDMATRHRQAWDLIPWAVNGRASEQERAIISQHLAVCGDCREEFEFQSRTAAAIRQDQAEDEALTTQTDRIWQRLEAQVKAEAQPAPLRRLRWATPLRLLAAAALVEAVGLAALGTDVLTSHQPVAAGYRTLSAAPATASSATVRLVLSPALSVGDFQNLLSAVQMQVVAGPSEAGVYSLAPLPGNGRPGTQVVLKRLRANPSVRFAEPVETQAQLVPAS
jgi:hypothetical protein